MRRAHIAVATLLAVMTIATTRASAADVHIGIDIVPPTFAFEAPPRVVVVPGVPTVHYAPDVGVNYFTYGDRYYTYDDGHWFVAHEGRGPWTYVERRYVPAPVLRVPNRYYRVPPRLVGGGHWNPDHRSYNHKSSWHGDGHGHGNGHGKDPGHGKGHDPHHH